MDVRDKAALTSDSCQKADVGRSLSVNAIWSGVNVDTTSSAVAW